ncbi:MAG: SDR family NAD(P)-dependent oxidoreductase [Rhodospirillales bacterium]|nr:SDR family NAD(P)-dependent oxidoreductase [Rhodospirillales bacterium]
MSPAAARLEGRIALVTGASRGIGRAVARRFADEGAHVIALARTKGGLEELDDEIRGAGGQVTLVVADLSDFAAIDRIGGAINERFRRLDVMVGNAAQLGPVSPLIHVAPEPWEKTIGLNVTANWRLIRSFDPLLRRSDSGRAIFVTSGIARGPIAYFGPYTASKAALEALALTYAAETTKTKIRVNLISPGVVRTRMRAEAFPGEDAKTVKPPESVTDAFVELASADCRRHGEIVALA